MAKKPDTRDRIEALMSATVADEEQHHDWTYDAVRPMPVPPSWRPGQKVKGDCSKGYQYLCRWSDAPDPMHDGFSPFGNSTTMWTELEHIDLAELEVGDPIAFGPNGSKHATGAKRLIRKDGRVVDVVMWSFGHQGAPNEYLLSQDGRPHQCLRLPVKPSGKTPESVLRAKKGYGAWRQWRLGTGAWRGYGKANRSVRPDVPRRIPVAWWRLYAHWLVAHRKGRGNPAKPGG